MNRFNLNGDIIEIYDEMQDNCKNFITMFPTASIKPGEREDS